MIRPYTISDKNQLIEVFTLNTPKFFGPKEIPDYIDFLEKHSKTYFTILHQDKIVGGVGCHVEENDKSGRITWIFIDPKYAGIGLGTMAVDHCLAILTPNPMVEKLVVTTSQLAYTFFSNFDFKLIKIKKDHWAHGLDLYLMERDQKQKTNSTT